MTLSAFLRYAPFIGMALYSFANVMHGFILRKLVKNGDIIDFPYGKRGPHIKRVKGWIAEAKNDNVKGELEKSLLWGRLSYLFFFVFISQVIVAIFFIPKDVSVKQDMPKAPVTSQKVLTGDWVNEKYVKEIRAGKSISAAQQDGILVSFDPHSDSMGYANFYFHAGPGPFEITKKDSIYQFGGNAFNFRDTTYNVKIVSPFKIVIGNDVYLKVDDSAMGDLRIVEKFLFNGKYKMQDGREVEFDEYGYITGLDSNDSYSAEYDYIAGPDGSVNRISMGKENSKLHDYGFKYNGDTLFICQVNKDKNDTTDEPSGFKRSLGKVIYKMWRSEIPITN